jgi:hypothetical protein
MSSSNNIIKIMNHINKLKNDDAIFDYLDSIENMNQIFNKSDETHQIDFIKYILSKMKHKDNFKLILPSLKITNIYVLRTLLDWSINYDEYNLCYFLFHRKYNNIIFTTKEYLSYEEKTNNKEIALLLHQFKVKETYNYESDSDDSSDSNSSCFESDDSTSFSDSDDSTSFSEDDYESESYSEEETNTNSRQPIDVD